MAKIKRSKNLTHKPTNKGATESVNEPGSHEIPDKPPTTGVDLGNEEPSEGPDFEFIKIILAAVLGQILFARRCFQPSNFQVIPADHLSEYETLEDIMNTKAQPTIYDTSLLMDKKSTLIFRHGEDPKFASFLRSIIADILPLLEKRQLVKLRLPIRSSKEWKAGCLLEYWSIYFSYGKNGICNLDVWRAGSSVEGAETPVAGEHLWQLGCYLAQLPPLTGPFYLTQAFHATRRPDGLTGSWNYSSFDFDEAKLKLQQNPGYSFHRILSLELLPLKEDLVQGLQTLHPSSIESTASKRGSRSSRDKTTVMSPGSPSNSSKSRDGLELRCAGDTGSDSLIPDSPKLPKLPKGKEVGVSSKDTPAYQIPNAASTSIAGGVSSPTSFEAKNKMKATGRCGLDEVIEVPPSDMVETQQIASPSQSQKRKAENSLDPYDPEIIKTPEISRQARFGRRLFQSQFLPGASGAQTKQALIKQEVPRTEMQAEESLHAKDKTIPSASKRRANGTRLFGTLNSKLDGPGIGQDLKKPSPKKKQEPRSDAANSTLQHKTASSRLSSFKGKRIFKGGLEEV